MKEKHISIKDYHYNLPDLNIAQYPLLERDSSKLVIYKNGDIQSSVYKYISDFLPNESLLFFNNTKVIPARLFFKTSANKTIEVFCLEPLSDDENVYSDMLKKGMAKWKCFIGGASKWKEQFVYFNSNHIKIKAEKLEILQGSFIVEFTWEPDHYTFAEVLHFAGAIPIPPYLNRMTESIDLERYQTIYAKKEGSVAAPTAGLHFTDNIIAQLKNKNITPTYITLHVGAGTFKPVKTDTMEGHEMHGEYIDVSLETIQYLFENIDKSITAVGTTSLRTLESIYWIGLLIYNNPNISFSELTVSQWKPYEYKEHEITLRESLASIITYLNKNNLTAIYAKTSILIVPGYKFKVVNQLITNFHQPESTLILLVAAFIGEDWKRVYDFALKNEYRFLSYGDGSLLFRNN